MGCDGSSQEVIESRICSIPVVDFRNQYALDYPDLVFAKIRSRNINGWSGYTGESLSSAMIMTEPVTMGPVRRGSITDQYHVHIEWDALFDDDIKGSTITSYYVQWDKGTGATTWYDLVGLTTANLELEYVAYFGDIE